MTTLERFAQIAQLGGERFWDFLDIKDILNLSVCARATAGLIVPQATLNNLLRRHERISKVGNFTLRFPTNLSTGMVRRVLTRVTGSLEATLVIDDRAGRIVLDIGSAFHDNEAHLADAAPVQEEDEEPHEIFKQLELISFDEYDDFNPRHPLPKDRAHRRGDSYFNSDIEMVVGELGAQQDLSSIAKAALALDDDAPTTPGGLSSADKPPMPPKMSAKDRILAKTKNNYPGRTKVKTVKEDDDEDDN